MSSTASQLRAGLQDLTDRLAAVIRQLPVKFFDHYAGGVIVVCPKYYFGDRTTAQQCEQLKIKREYEEWIALLRSVLRGGTQDVTSRIKEADQYFRIWLELGENWSLSDDPQANVQKCREDASRFSAILDILGSGAPSEIILVPDTNSLADSPDPSHYRGVAGSDVFVFLLLPTVLGELDELKNLHRNPDFRDKAKKVITRIKGWRAQGSLRNGVTVDRTITVSAIANEPDMKNAPSWLDPAVRDDRILASVLEVQASHPSARVVLVTGDINLSNKAAAARIEHAER